MPTILRNPVFLQLPTGLSTKSFEAPKRFQCSSSRNRPSRYGPQIKISNLFKSNNSVWVPKKFVPFAAYEETTETTEVEEAQKGLFRRSQRSSKVVAFYGLTTPPYKLDALEPFMSQKTLEVHWGKHHRNYVDSLNKQLENNNPLYGCTMEELIKVTYNSGNPLPEFNNAAQVWNHDFFWESMQPEGGKIPGEGVIQQIEKDFGSFTNFKDKFVEAASSLFGSGWIWLVVKREEKKLSVVKTSNAITPLVFGDIPIICLNLWEHAYYLDYKNDRVRYVNTFLNHLVSWNTAAARMARAEAFVNLGEPKVPVA